MPDAAGLPMRSQAWLTVDGVGTVALAGQVARIGRHRDNDIRLADRSVHRHHAVIERTPDEAFLLTDVRQETVACGSTANARSACNSPTGMLSSLAERD